ncbi:MAG: tRNA pseudouridine(55) synthase TruB [Chloroflexota bacterium]
MNGTRRAAPEGFLNVSKPYGWTSHDVVQLVRRLAGTRRVGHGGTLDPAATGVLVVAVGRATRLVDYLGEQDKSYCGDVVLGAATTTDDAEGSVLYARDPSALTLDQLVEALSGFLGELDQVPPQYSAVKLEGKKAYEIARKGGQAALRARRVTIKGIAVVAWEPPTASILVRCSKGTYIRSLARDLGERLGVGGHLGALVRTASGPFDCGDAVGVEDLRLAAEFGYLDRLIWPPDLAVAHLPAVVVSGPHAEDMKGGRRWAAVSAPAETKLVRVYTTDGAFLGLAELQEGRWQPKLVLVSEEE